MENEKVWRWGLPFVFLVGSFLYILPFFPWQQLAYTVGQDGRFHLERMEELFLQIQQGPSFSYLSNHTFGLIGYGVNFFYPFLWLFLFVPARFLVTNPLTAYYLFIMVVTFITFAISYYAYHEFRKQRLNALFFSFIYTFSGFRAMDFFGRTAIGEVIAITFIPLVFLGFYQIVCGDKRKWWQLSLGMAGILYSHVLSVFMSTLLLVILYVMTVPVQRQRVQTLVNGLKSIGLTVLLSAGFLVPFLDQYLQADLLGVMETSLAGRSYPLLEQLRFTLQNMYIPGGARFNIGFILFLLVVAALPGVFRATRTAQVSYAAGILLLICSSNTVPWELFQETPLALIQFPWRLLAFAVFFFAVAVSEIVPAYFKKQNWQIGFVSAIFVIGLGLHFQAAQELFAYNQTLTTNGRYYDLNKDTYEDILSKKLNTDYMPAKAEPHFRSIYKHHVLMDGIRGSVKREYENTYYTYDFNLKSSTVVDFPVFAYRHMWVYANGKKVAWQPSFRGTVEVKLPPGKYLVKVGNRLPLLYKLSWLVSFGTIIGLLGYAWRGRNVKK